MMLRWIRAAEQDLSHAPRWYEQQRAGLADKFLEDVSLALQRIDTDPASYPLDEAAPAGRIVRSCSLARFPYRIVFEVQPNQVAVLAMAHASRHPEFWQNRP